MITGADIVKEAREWLGTRWQHQACVKGVACDCIGLIGGVAAATGVSDAWVTDKALLFRNYGPTPMPGPLLAGCHQFLDAVPGGLAHAQLGDVLIMRYDREPGHFGILSSLDPMQMIHSHAQFPRRVVENSIDEVWRNRIIRVFRFRGLA
jgi:NlpC/P60 family putative phage cell wall peptidase